MMAATVVKSKYMVDPHNKNNLIKREDDDSLALDREYWERVNQGDNVRGAARMFESSPSGMNTADQPARDPVRVGKLRSRAGFLESLQGGEVDSSSNYRDQVKTGKLNVADLFSLGQEEESLRAEVRVGKLNRQEVGKFTGIVEAVPAVVKPRMKIGKLDPKNVFDNTDDKENDVDRRSSVVIGKINARNIFENNSEDRTETKRMPIVVGKINTKEIFAEDNGAKDKKADIKVGKLKINEEELFEAKDDSEKTVIQVGKLNTKELFNASPTEEKAEKVKFYKPSVQPKKLKMFPVEREEDRKDEVKVGKIDTSRLFEQEEEEREERVTVGRLNLSNVFQEKEEEEVRSKPRVGKLRHNIYEVSESEDPGREVVEVKVGKIKNVFTEAAVEKEAVPPVKLRGARRVNKGNRISCLIENLHTDKKPDDSDEEERDAADREVEEVKLGRDRMSMIQSMFSGDRATPESPLGKQDQTSSCVNDFSELRDEGLVSSNLQRFTTGNLRKTSQDLPRKTSLETNYIDKKHLESVTSKFEESSKSSVPSLERPKHRKLRTAEDLFQHTKEDYTDCVRTEVRVGKLDSNKFKPRDDDELSNNTVKVGKLKNTENMFEKKDDLEEMDKPVLRVGKLNKDVFNPAPESPKEEKPEIKVGKISTKDLFAEAEANSEELLREVRVGKLSQSRLTLASTTDITDTMEYRELDTDIVPTGGVSQKANVFSNTKPKSPSKLNCPKMKRTESSADSDMQKKYEQQMASKALMKQASSASLVVKKEPLVKKSPVVKIKFGSCGEVLSQTSVGDDSQSEELTVEEMLAKTETRVEVGKMKEARSNFFSSMIASSSSSSSSSSSAQRIGTSIMPTVSAEDCQKFEVIEREKMESASILDAGRCIDPRKSRGKALFQRMAEREREEQEEGEEEVKMMPVELLPGVDMEEMKIQVMMRQPMELLQGMDLEEIEDEFEKLHREMMNETR